MEVINIYTGSVVYLGVTPDIGQPGSETEEIKAIENISCIFILVTDIYLHPVPESPQKQTGQTRLGFWQYSKKRNRTIQRN